MSIADKLIYLNGTKEKLKDSINNIGGSITDETTFRAYATELDNIYSNIPKTTGEGSNLSLSTIKGRINVDDILGDTEQEGTPTPSTPIDIEVVTGEQEVVVSNKNLITFDSLTDETALGIEKTFNSSEMKLNGTSTGAGQLISNGSPLNITIPAGTYKLTYKLKSGTATRSSSSDDIALYLKDETSSIATITLWQIVNASSQGFSVTITTTESKSLAFYSYCNASGIVLNNVILQVQLEKGSTSTDYVEHQEQTKTLSLGDIELAKIGTYQDRIYKNDDKWYIEKNIGHKKASEITENDIGGAGGSQSVYFTSSFTNVIANRTLQVYSNVQTWKNTTDTEWNTLNGNYIGVLFNVQQIYINKTASTKSELITWLNSINFEMYYVLSTPTYTEITNETLLQELEGLEKLYSYNGVTNITTTSDTGCDIILSVSALKGA